MEQMEYEDSNIEEDGKTKNQTSVKTLHTKDNNSKENNTKLKCADNVKRNSESEETSESEDEVTNKCQSESEDEVTNKCQSGNKNKHEDAHRNTKLNYTNIKLEDEDESCESKHKTINDSKNENGDKLEDMEKKDKGKIKSKDREECFSDATYLAQEMRSTEMPSAADMKKLYNLHVHLRHEVPPQHKIEKRPMSHVPTKDEIQRFEQIVPCRKGTYSSEEDDIIIRNWKAFCKIHDWEVSNTTPFVHLKNGTMIFVPTNLERRKFILFLANDLFNRTLFSIYQRFKTLHITNINTRYTGEEDEMIIDHLENNPYLDERRKYADLAKVLKRTRHSIWRRYRILKKKRLNNTM